MRRISFLALAALLAVACNNSPKTTSEALLLQEINDYQTKVYLDTTLTDTAKDSMLTAFFEEKYLDHADDSLGIKLFTYLITNLWDPEVSLDRFESASELIRTNPTVSTKIAAIKNIDSVAPGKTFIDLSGPDAIDGNTLSISGILAEGKPLIVDFWASWCPPCRKEISEKLVALSLEAKVNIIGIAVWEKSIDDTRKAMKDLSVTWPVIYTGGRENSPSVTYGVTGIPTLFLISPDGVILARGHSIEEFAALL